MESFVHALCVEMDVRKDFFHCNCDNFFPNTVYVGGGTPSQLPIDYFSRIVNHLDQVFFDSCNGMKDVDEFTIEVNPDDITLQYATALRRLGANRISMGVQSFDDAHLRWMNRRHSSKDALAAFQILRSCGFDNISIDLIFGYRPDGNSCCDSDALIRSWQSDLEMAVSIRPEHISAYQMSIEPGSSLGELAAAGKYEEPDAELCACQYELLQKTLAEAGYCQYEVSNFALPRRQSRHNSSYWEREPYIGLGPGAHSFIGKRRSWNLADIAGYLTQSFSSAPADCYEELTPENVVDEIIMLGLRKVKGFNLAEIPTMYQDDIAARAADLASRGLVITNEGNIWIPAEKLFISEYIIETFLG